MEKSYKKSSYAHLLRGDASYGTRTVTLHADDGPLVVYAPGGGQHGGSFFPHLWEKGQKTRRNPPKEPGPTKFPPLPTKSGAGNTGPPVKCHMLPDAGETLSDEAVFRKPHISKSCRKSILIGARALVPKPQVSSQDFSIQGVTVPLKPRSIPAGDEEKKMPLASPPSPILQPRPPPQPRKAKIVSSLDVSVKGVAVPLKPRSISAEDEDMKIPPAPPPSPILQPSPPPLPCPYCASQRAAKTSRPRVQIGGVRSFRPMPYTWSKWCS